MNVIEVRHVRKTFGSLVANDDMSLSLEAGRVLAVIGPNGAGKSTLLKMICGLIVPDSGQILLDGRPTASLGAGLYRRLSAVLEDSSLAYMYLKGWDNLFYQGALYGFSRRQTLERAGDMLDTLDLRRHMDKRIGDWSRGTQQKLALVVGLLARPQIMLLDEPTLGLDVVAKRDFLTVVRQRVAEGMAVIVTSHQSEVIDGLADDMLLIESGHSRWQGGADEFKQRFQQGSESLEDTLLRMFDQADDGDNGNESDIASESEVEA